MRVGEPGAVSSFGFSSKFLTNWVGLFIIYSHAIVYKENSNSSNLDTSMVLWDRLHGSNMNMPGILLIGDRLRQYLV